MSTADLDALLAGGSARTDGERSLLAAIDALRVAPPRAPEHLRARVGALRPEPRRWRVPPTRRILFVLVPAAAALAVAAALVHGIAGSRTGGVQHGQAAAKLHSFDAPQASTTIPAGAGGTGGSGSFAPQAVRKIAAPAPAPSPGRLTRYQASITVRVDGDGRLSDATNRATAVARGVGGYAASVEYRTPAGRAGQAFLELRVPTDRVQDALARLAALGTLVAQRVSVQDLQSRLERQSAQIGQLRREIRLLAEALRSPLLTPLQRVELRLRLGEAKRSLAQRTHARKSTVAAGTLARVSLVLTSEQGAAVVPHRRSRVDRLLRSAVSFLGLEATVALYALIVTAPLLVLAALAWAAAAARRRREERRLLSAPT